MKKEKELTIKELAPYLPYGLKGKCFWKNDDGSFEYEREGELIELIREYDPKRVNPIVVKSKSYPESKFYSKLAYDYETFKPLLHPLSDLTREIEHNGERFVPAKLLWSVDAVEEDAFDCFKAIPEYWGICLNQLKQTNGYCALQYRDMEILFKYHFDVFNLIPAGLAIDINSITAKQ